MSYLPIELRKFESLRTGSTKVNSNTPSSNAWIRLGRNQRLYGASACFMCCLALIVPSALARTDRQPHNLEHKHAVEDRSLTLLEVGRPIRRELAGGGAHSYHLQLLAGQYAHCVAYQRGIDIAMSLFRPDGSHLAQMDRWSYMWGAESLSVIARVSGTYRLEVRAANAEDRLGLYDLELTEVRSPTERDALVIAAETAYAEGDELSSADTLESRRLAIGRLEDALRLWRLAADKLFEATTLLYIGVDYYDSGDAQKALHYYAEALPIWKALNDGSGEAATYEYLAIAHNSLGDFEQALTDDRRALSLAHRAREKKMEAEILHQLGRSYFLLGDNGLAADYFRRAVTLSQSQRDRIWEAHSLHHLGEVYFSSGRPQTALVYLNAALEKSRAVNDSLGEATALNHIGSVYRSLGRYQEAMPCHIQALDLRKIAGYRLGEAQTLIELGLDYESADNLQEARSYYAQALHLAMLLRARREEASSLYGVARIDRSQNDLDESLTHIEAAMEIIEELRSTIDDSDLRASYFGSVRGYYDFYVELLMELHRLSGNEVYAERALEASERVRARVLLETLNRAHANIQKGIAPGLLRQEQTLQRSIDAKSISVISLLSHDHTELQIAEADKQLEALNKQYRDLLTFA